MFPASPERPIALTLYTVALQVGDGQPGHTSDDVCLPRKFPIELLEAESFVRLQEEGLCAVRSDTRLNPALSSPDVACGHWSDCQRQVVAVHESLRYREAASLSQRLSYEVLDVVELHTAQEPRASGAQLRIGGSQDPNGTDPRPPLVAFTERGVGAVPGRPARSPSTPPSTCESPWRRSEPPSRPGARGRPIP